MATNVKVLYLCDFDLSRGTGKDRATFQKVRALEKKVEKLKVVSHTFGGPLFRFFSIFLLDLKATFFILLERPDWLISRGYVGFFTQSVSKFLGVTTVREVHAFALEESSLLPYSGLKSKVISLLARLANKIDLSADIRIFNHPDLLAWYEDQGMAGKSDFFVYNGFDYSAKCNLSKAKARTKFGFKEKDRIVVFTGAASKWHGVEYIIELKRFLNVHEDNIVFAFGGGDISSFDPDRLCVNFSPLDERGCAELICAADFCALPVKHNRVSPGSPLKLYDYIVNERYVLAQSGTKGYSDEVLRFGIGKEVDFTSKDKARTALLEAFDADWPECYPKCPVSWSDRMDLWIEGISGFRRQSS